MRSASSDRFDSGTVRCRPALPAHWTLAHIHIDVGQIERDQFANAHPGRVERFQHRLIAQRFRPALALDLAGLGQQARHLGRTDCPTYLATFGDDILAAGSACMMPSLRRNWQKLLIAAVLRATVDEA